MVSVDREILTEEERPKDRSTSIVAKSLCVFVCLIVVGFISVVMYEYSKNQSRESYESNYHTEFQYRACDTEYYSEETDISGPAWLRRMEEKMSLNYSPCCNFYERTCKIWENNIHLVTNTGYTDQFVQVSVDVYDEIYQQLASGNLEGTAEQKARVYFNSCLKTNRDRDRARILQKIKNLIDSSKTIGELGWGTEYKSIQSILTMVHTHNHWPLFKLLAAPDPNNVTGQLLTLQVGDNPLNFHKSFFGNVNTPAIEEAKDQARSIGTLDIDSSDQQIIEAVRILQKLSDADDEGKKSVRDKKRSTDGMDWSFDDREGGHANPRINTPMVEIAKERAEALDDVIDDISDDDETLKEAIRELKEDRFDPLASSNVENGHIRKRRSTAGESETQTSSIEWIEEKHTREIELIFKYIFGFSDEVVTGMESILYDQSSCARYDKYGWCLETKSVARKAADDVLNIEVKIIKAMSAEKSYKKTKAFEYLTLYQLQEECPFLNWSEYIKDISNGTITGVEKIVVIDKKSVSSMCDLIFKNKDESSLKQYLLVSLVKSLEGYFDIGLLQDNNKWTLTSDKEFQADHWWRCMTYTEESIGLATGSILVRNSFNHNSVSQVKQIVDYIKKAFRSNTLRKSWMDNSTVASAIKKLDSMIEKIGYPSYITNQTYRDGFFEKLQLTVDHYENVLSSKKFQVEQIWKQLKTPVDRTTWLMLPSETNAAHNPMYNDITVPLAIMRPPFFDHNRPMALNFGSIGAIIGHELTHAFGTRVGQYFDFEGARNDWMSRSAEEALTKKSKCFIDQYDQYRLQGTKIDGKITLDENIADNGGIRAAYQAYQLWKADHLNETYMGSDHVNITSYYAKNDFTEQQLFFVAFSQMYCSKYTEASAEATVKHIHAPGPLRVRGALSNMPEFTSTFGCRHLNPYSVEKCIVW